MRNPSSNRINNLLCSLSFHGRPLFISNFYCPPSSPSDLFTLSSTLSSLPHSIISNLLLVGDFNVDFSSPSLSCPLFNTLQDLKDSFSLSQVITEPTHFSPSGSPSVIDLAFIPSTMSSACCILPPLSTSDHQCILLTVSQPKSCSSQPSTPRRRVWLYKHADIDKMNDLLDSISWDSILSDDLDSSWAAFRSCLLSIAHSCIPSKLLLRYPLPPWIPRPLIAKIRLRQRLFSKAKSLSSPTLFSAYERLHNSITSSLYKAKSSFFSNLSNSPPSKFWAYTKSLRKSSSSVPLLQLNKPFTSDWEKAECLNSFFSSCFNSSASPLSPIPPFSPPPQCPDSLLCSEETILSLIADLPTKTGPDSISSYILKSTASSIASPRSHIFNLSISSGLFPLTWKSSHIVPIPKSSPPSTSPSDFRPISLLSLVSKLLEKHVHSILLDFCFQQDLISPMQFGFLPSRSTTSALYPFCHFAP